MNGGDGLDLAVADADQKQREGRGVAGTFAPLAGPTRGKEDMLNSVHVNLQT